MIVLVLTACPSGLRGHLSRWLLEISPGVFVGHISARVRDLLWERVLELAKDGRAILIHSTKGEQRLAFKVHRHDWQPTDFDGVQLMLRPAKPSEQPTPALRKGWSNASRYRAAARQKRDG
ncbi:type I-E CRISPR-associated endoribonuclease Cas2e [Rathayibacter toxicus]|uniref:CRISPR-associated protein Cas2 n=1 Tax=Rathayibacter toxicus TaxID=145458 RepID=A0A0C5BF60_9MICO|nr:type I-E CRISPR-associated endoribonuclease Cas2e [Rathayibacter toxicus]AJM76845.1 CRISPR-associated protein Cas2 [Rathayibacter toxicus]ALS57394.1 type I-E CRISPR-associated endoribonuclease Cas2 [Rathayibacter toxicus]KKM45644.1 CRISPR-associated protein Cas2 [Rathayibacter toxicus]PPG24728.1 type I-E CRISPR-associated endoribonuclease Cas2 [Rathayibacter toxicus]PPG48182.1 type I-E CRISPR-associated endoribonuclease Cas2 [Rathayibacter toxicus]